MSSPDFASLGLAAPVLEAVQALGYEQPSPIQAQAIPLLLAGKNLLGTAQTGTGKTAAFALPLLSNLDTGINSPQILVLTPTRELAIQVAEAFQSYAKNMKGFHVLPVYGGADIRGQLRGLQRGAQIVVGTPGRILDHLRRRSLKLGNLNSIVLDEADEMLRMGFIDDVEAILAETPDTCQRALFSATMPPAIKRVADTYLGDAEQVSIAAKTRTVERISQRYLTIKHHHKMDALTRILEVEEFDGMIIFVRTKQATVEIADKLAARGFSADALNGDLNQATRERTIDKLKKGAIDIIVATDVAARGLDVERISHVVNYDIPYDNESYVHRIGRTGRAGREGNAILFVTPKEQRLLRSIEKSTRQPISAMTLPSNEQISDQRVDQFTRQLIDTVQSAELDQFRALAIKIAEENELELADIAGALAFAAQRERPLYPVLEKIESQHDKRERNERPEKRQRSEKRDRPERGDRDERASRPEREPRKRKRNEVLEGVDMVTYRLEVGLDDGVTPSHIVGAIANEADIDSQFIGHISLHDDHATVELPDGMPSELFQHLKKVRICQKPLQLSVLGQKKAEKKSGSKHGGPKKGHDRKGSGKRRH